MKRFEKLMLSTTAFTVLILFFFYLFAVIGGFTEPLISFPTFLLILGFGFIISVSSLILKVERIKKSLRVLVHYASLMLAFTVVFIISGNLSSGGTPVIFSAIVVFTFLYAVIFTASYFVKKAVASFDSKIDAQSSTKKTVKTKKEYKSLYSSKD